MRNCFICATPYQILAAISLVREFKKTGDLYIVNQFAGAKTLAERIKNESVFKDVIYIDEEALYSRYDLKVVPLTRRLDLVRSYKYVDLIVKSFIRNESEYENVFVSSNFLTGRLIILYLYKHYGLSLYSLFDDGLGSYRSKRFSKVGLFDRVCREVLIHKGAGKISISGRYLYRDDLYQKMNFKKGNETIHKLNFLSQDNYDLVFRLFGLNHPPKIDEKVIILDTIREVELTDKGERQIAELFDLISTTLDPDQLIFKKHPRDKRQENNLHYLTSYGDINLPFEAYALFQNFSDKVLITNISTAVFSPKMMLDQEPTIILLFKILEHELRNPVMIDVLVRNFRDLYRDPSKIYTPESKEELVGVLQGLKLGRNEVPT